MIDHEERVTRHHAWFMVKQRLSELRVCWPKIEGVPGYYNPPNHGVNVMNCLIAFKNVCDLKTHQVEALENLIVAVIKAARVKE